MRKIGIASDHAGFSLKEKIKPLLIRKGFLVKDFGAGSEERCDYPEYAFKLSREVSLDRLTSGILICKSGIGNSIVANKLPGVRAALCYNVTAARLSRQHNDSNVLILGAAFVNEKAAKRIVGVWLATKFEGGRHKRRLDQIRAIERKIRSKVR